MHALLLTLVLTSADGGITFDAPLYVFCPLTTQQAVTIDGGFVLLPPERAQRAACLLETCEAHRQVLEQDLGSHPAPLPWTLWAVGVAVAGGVGFGTAWALAHAGVLK